MEQIIALSNRVGNSIAVTVEPTLDIFAPLLLKNKALIHSIPKETESYGPNPHHYLDIYRAPQTNAPILIFLYGGGFISGDKTLSAIPEGVLYHNLGTFFASRGITTIIPDYRLVQSTSGGDSVPSTSEGNAIFPSGGEDVSLVMKWLERFCGTDATDVFVLGNSAGGVHLATFLFAPQFSEQRQALVSGKNGITLKGVIGLGVPFYFKNSCSYRLPTLQAYYGSPELWENNCPLGLLRAYGRSGAAKQDVLPTILLLYSEFDPEDEIGQTMREFHELAGATLDLKVELRTLMGHNHVSPAWALMSGDSNGDKWGEEVTGWIQSLCI